MKKKSRLLALLLTLAMVLTYMPALAFAEEPDGEDDPYYEFVLVGDEGASPVLFSDGEIQFRLPEEAVVPEDAHFDLTVGVVDWEMDAPEGDMDARWTKFTQNVEYSFDEKSMTLTLYGQKVYDKLGKDSPLDFFGGAIPNDATGKGGWLCGGKCEFKVVQTPNHDKDEEAAEEAARKAEAEKAAAELAEWNGVLNTKIPAAKSVKVKAAKKKVTVSWTKANSKNLKKFDTVEIQVCTDKKFDKANTIRKTVKKTKKSLAIKKLTSKKTYYVRVRDVKGSGATKQVSKWSKPKKVKIK